MREKIKVLIVDDAVLVRKMLSDVVAADPELEVLAAAPNGKLALQRFSLNRPDIVVLDLEMPEMSGLETISELRKIDSTVPIVMFSAFTETGAKETLEALSRGADDYVTKPTKTSGMSEAKDTITKELLPKLKALTQDKGVSKHQASLVMPPSSREKRTGQVDVVCIGVSTGGPNALGALIPQLPSALGVPVLITQHMPPMFTKMLASRLADRCKKEIVEATEGDVVRPNTFYIAPGGAHLTVLRDQNLVRIRISDAPPENSCRPSVDVMLRSAVQVYGSRILTVILTGMGQDGLLGCKEVYDRGGTIFAEHESTCVVYGMPGAVIKAGVAHEAIPLTTMGSRVCEFVHSERKGCEDNRTETL